MKRVLLIPALALALVACGGSDVQDPGGGSASAPATTAPGTELTVTVWADPSTSAAPTVTTVTAAPGATAKDFAPTPAGQACTMIFGGTDKATVTGTLDGAAVDATFTRSNGCEIARWDRMVALKVLPPGAM
jgi:hypothetical protein